ncbi:hypothetical protein FRB96_004592 [Tulasnella sp. 330]|nr:hypothetical protein FRB96_004592 [Tulasnella sp. 330]
MDSKELDVTPPHTVHVYDRLGSLFSGVVRERRIIFLALIVNFGALLLGYDSGIAGAIIVLPSFQQAFGIQGSAKQVANTSSNIVSILYGGCLIGGLLASWTSYRFGRRRSLLFGCVFFISGGIVQTTSTAVTQIYIGRGKFISPFHRVSHQNFWRMRLQAPQISRRSDVSAVPGYWRYAGLLDRIRSQHKRLPDERKTVSVTTTIAPIDLRVSDLTYPVSCWSGRIPIGLQLLPSVIFTVGLCFLSESPRYLAFQQISHERRRRAEGLAVLDRFPVDESKPHLLKDAELFAPTPGSNHEGVTTYLTTHPPKSTNDGETTYGDLGKPRANHFLSQLVHLLFHSRNRDGDQDHHQQDAFAPLYALAYLRNIPISSPSIKAEMAEIYAQLDEIEEDRLRGRTSWRALLRNPSVRRRFAVAGFIGSWQIWTAQNAILYYAPTIFMSIGFSSRSTSLLASGVFTCLKVVSTIVALIFTINRYGRVQGLTVGGLLQGIIFFIIGILLDIFPTDPTDAEPAPPNIAMMAMIYLYVFVYSFTLGPLPWVYSSELFPPHIREAGQLLFVVLTWTNNYAVAKLTPIGFAEIGWKLWMVYGTLNIAGAGVCWLLCPETKGKSMEEIDIVFGAVSEEQRSSHVAQVLGIKQGTTTGDSVAKDDFADK